MFLHNPQSKLLVQQLVGVNSMTHNNRAFLNRMRGFKLILIWAISIGVEADVVLDGSAGAPAGTVGGAQGFDYFIDEALGQRAGGNLFFSFGEFNIASGEEAHFHADSAGITNLISRVTGVGASTIDGTVSSSIDGANLWLVNSNGIIVGDGASFDVDGALYLSTAQALAFSDDNIINMEFAEGVSLTVASPESFHFLSPSTTSINLGDVSVSIAPNSQFHLSANQVDIANFDESFEQSEVVSIFGAEASSVINPHSLEANIAAGEISIENSDFNFTNASDQFFTLNAQDIDVTGGEVIALSTELSASIFPEINIVGNSISLQGLDIASVTRAQAGKGANINVAAENDLLISSGEAGSSIFRLNAQAADARSGSLGLSARSVELDGVVFDATVASFVQGVTIFAGDMNIDADESILFRGGAQFVQQAINADGGEITLSASEIRLDGATSEIRADSFDTNLGTFVSLNADTVILENGAEITQEVENGTGAGVEISSGDMFLRSGALLSTRSFLNATGSPIAISTGVLEITEGASINASVVREGQGGELNITTGRLLINGSNAGLRETGIFVQAGERQFEDRPGVGDQPNFGVGDGGSALIFANEVSIENGGVIASDTTRSGRAGSIFLNVGSLNLSGRNSAIIAETTGLGNAGNITILGSNDLSFFDSAVVSSSSGLNAEGDAGAITISSARNVSLTESAQVASNTSGLGDAGEISVSSIGQMNIDSGAAINSTTNNSGNAGRINLAANQLILGETGLAQVSTSSQTIESGASGEINILADSINLLDGQVSVDTASNVAEDTGDISLIASNLSISNQSAVTATATGETNSGAIAVVLDNDLNMVEGASISTSSANSAGGDISILSAGGDLFLDNSEITTSAGGASAENSGGNILLEGIDLLLLKRDSQILTQANAGNGGAIDVGANFVLAEQGSTINADSISGESGVITFSSPDLDVNAALTDLDIPVFDVSGLLRNACAAISAEGKGRSSLIVTESLIQPEPGNYISGKISQRSSTFTSNDVDSSDTHGIAKAALAELAAECAFL